VLGELISGFDHGQKAKQNRKELHQFLESSRVKIYAVTPDTANFYSQVFLSLKRKGPPIPTNGMWIAAQALEHGCIVCTFDKHFNAIDGLLTGNTLTELFI
jgi:tRNA(fMet)-specific endonuclease VapC